MAYTLHPVSPTDAPALARIFQRAFAADGIIGFMNEQVPPDARYSHDLKFFGGLIAQGEAWGGRMWKLVEDGTGEIVAFSRWTFPVRLTPEQKAEKEREEAKREHAVGTRVALAEDFFEQLFRGRERWIEPETMFFLHILAVDPSHQRQGLGTKLIAPGLEAADRAGAKAYVEASSKGLPLYLKYGWVPVDEMVIDLTPYGGEGIARQKFLMREPGVGSV